MALDEHMESVSIVYFCQVFKLGVFTTPSMNEFFDTRECIENTVELEDLEKRKCRHEVLCKGGKYGSMGFNCGILFVFSGKSNPQRVKKRINQGGPNL